VALTAVWVALTAVWAVLAVVLVAAIDEIKPIQLLLEIFNLIVDKNI
jgi:hypothetical protein